MKNLYLVCGLVGALGLASQAFAQDCATPIQIHSDQHGITGDTCTAGNPLPSYGGTGSPQNEIIYTFTAQGANADISLTANGGYAGSTAGVFLFPACSPSTDPVAFGVPGAGNAMHVGGLVDGQQYFVAVTADPGGPNDGCGQFTMDIDGTLPVGLKSFSVD